MGACPGSTFPLRDVQYSLTRNSFEMFRPWFLRNSYKSEKQSVKRQTPRHSVFVCLSVIRNTLLYPSQKRMINPGCYRFPDGGLHPRRSRLWSVRLGSLHVKTSVEHHGDLDNLFQCVCVRACVAWSGLLRNDLGWNKATLDERDAFAVRVSPLYLRLNPPGGDDKEG